MAMRATCTPNIRSNADSVAVRAVADRMTRGVIITVEDLEKGVVGIDGGVEAEISP